MKTLAIYLANGWTILSTADPEETLDDLARMKGGFLQTTDTEGHEVAINRDRVIYARIKDFDGEEDRE